MFQTNSNMRRFLFIPLSKFAFCPRLSNSCYGLFPISGECIGAIVHNRTCIIGCPQVVDFVFTVLQKVVLHSSNNVAGVDSHMLVTIRSRLFMPKT